MKFTRVRTKNSDLIVNVLSANTGELLALSELIKKAAESPTNVCVMIDASNPNNRTIVLNNEYFKTATGYDCGLCHKECPVRSYVSAHIAKWNIGGYKKPKPKPKHDKNRFKIKVE